MTWVVVIAISHLLVTEIEIYVIAEAAGVLWAVKAKAKPGRTELAFHHPEHVLDLGADFPNHEKVHRGDPVSVITKERLPTLRWSPPPRHILGHAGLANLDAKLEKPAMDPRRSPQRIGDAHLTDQPANFQQHRRSTAAMPRFPAPIQSDTDTMPTDHGVRSDDCQCIIHLAKQSADTSQYQSVNRDEGRSFGTGSPQYIDLLPQDQNFCLKRCSRPQQVHRHSKNQSAQIRHRAAASPNSRSTASRISFATGTAKI
ncbi:hypothetical protein V4R08_14990 [Nitrobacter sp. NHB1]|uniref:hypothetical protein n=1 Tax=Nitrobacter sp. NHB1 TaxID=3119830 RepID=UPI002FFDE997